MTQSKNVGSTDRMIRFIAGAVLLLWAFAGPGITSLMGIILAVLGVIAFGTGLTNFCPLFKMLGINSLGRNSSK